jgi:hypothetical protein
VAAARRKIFAAGEIPEELFALRQMMYGFAVMMLRRCRKRCGLAPNDVAPSAQMNVAFCPRQKAFIKPKVVEASASTTFFLNVCRKANISLAAGEYHCANGAISLAQRANIT